MSLLSDAGGMAQSVTDKATNNPLGSALDALAGGLSGSSAKGPEGKARFMDGGPIDPVEAPTTFPADPSNAGAPSPPKSNTPLSIDKPLQFLHLAYAHDDDAKRFPGDITSRGIAFRDALIRENVLLFSFAQAAKNVLVKNKESKGNASAMLDMAGSLLGGAKQAPQGPESFDQIFTQIRPASEPINKADFDYPAIHAAGLALAKAADSHNELCKTAMAKGGGGGMGLPSIPGLSSLAGGAGIPDIVAKIPEYLFKVQDAYLAMYREARIAYEWQLVKISHELSLAAIRGKWQPTFDIWGERNAEATEAAVEDNPSLVEQKLKDAQDMLEAKRVNNAYGATDTGVGSDARDKLVDAQNAIKDLRKSGEDKAQMIGGLLGTAADIQANLPPETVAALAKAFAMLAGDKEKDLPSLADKLAPALKEALGEGISGVMKPVVDKLCGAAVAALQKVYLYIDTKSEAPGPALVLAATHDAIATRIVGLLFHLIMGRDPEANDSTAKQQAAKSAVDQAATGSFGSAFDSAKSLVPSKDEAANKAAELVTNFLKSQGHYLDDIIFFIASDISDELARAWQEANAKNAVTMEVYLGRLPMLAATTVRNLLFPIFNLVLKIFGLADKLAGAVWDPVSAGVGKVTDAVTSAKDAKDDLNQAGKDANAAAGRVDQAIDKKKDDLTTKAGELGNLASSASSVDDLERIAAEKQRQANALGDEATATPDDLMKAAKGEDPAKAAEEQAKKDPNSGPLIAWRVAGGKAQKVTGGQIDSAGREIPVDEKVIMTARTGPSTAPPPPAAPAMPSLADVGNMF